MKTWLLANGPILRRRILIVLVFGIPILFLPFLYGVYNVPKLILLTVGVTVVAAIRIAELLQGASFDRWRALAIPAAAIVLPLAVGWLFSPYRDWALLGKFLRFQGLLPYVLVAVLGVLIADAFAGRAAQLAWVVAVTAGVVGADALLQTIGVDPFRTRGFLEVTGRQVSTIGNSNFTGGFLGIALPVTVALWALDARRRAWSTTFIALTVGGWLVAQSQGGWAAGAAGLAVVAGFYFTPRWRRARLGGAVVAAFIGVAIVGIVLVGIVSPESRAVPASIRARSDFWVAAGRMSADSPLVGRGPNAYAIEETRYRTRDDAIRFNYKLTDDPHSVPLALLTGAGVLGLVGYLIVLGWVVRNGVRLEPANLLGGAFLGAVAAYFVQSLISIDELSIRVAFWSALGGLVAATAPAAAQVASRKPPRRRGRRRPQQEPLRAWPVVALLALGSLVVTWWGLNYLVADRRVRRGTELFQFGQPEEAKQQFNAAIGFRPDPQYRKLYGYQLGGVALNLGRNGRSYLDDAKRAYAYVDDFPDVLAIVDYARLLHLYASVEPSLNNDALTLYRRALRLDPYNPLIRFETADTLVGLRRYDDALTTLQPAIAQAKKRYPQVWGEFAVVKARLGDEQAARAAIDRALALDPQQSLALKAKKLLGSTS